MTLELFAITLDVAGKLLVAFTALMVHRRFRKEHKVDAKVFYEMRREQVLGVLGILLIVAGYIVHLIDKL